jgi:mannose-1-phosphate guanylyltransferase/mannose-6-phosphate isomerase
MLEMGIAHPKLILEPSGRNTAPAIAMAALLIQQLYPGKNPSLLILPADHLIQEEDRFTTAINLAAPYAQDHLVTFGIQPSYAETGYGYIHAEPTPNAVAFPIQKFIEKPSKEKAEHYLQQKNYYWNSGLFLFSAQIYLTELQKFAPEIAAACQKEALKLQEIGGFFTLGADFESSPSESIDYAVMEKTQSALVCPLDVTWSDIGSWTALHDVLPHDADGNILQGDITCIETKNSMIRAEHRLVASVGVKDLIIIETADAVMVAHKDYAQKVKDLVAQLKIQQRKGLT